MKPNDKCSSCGAPWAKHKGIAATCAENTTLRAALEPFANAAYGIRGDTEDWLAGGVPGEVPFAPQVTAADFRRAAQALGKPIQPKRKPQGGSYRD